MGEERARRRLIPFYMLVVNFSWLLSDLEHDK